MYGGALVEVPDSVAISQEFFTTLVQRAGIPGPLRQLMLETAGHGDLQFRPDVQLRLYTAYLGVGYIDAFDKQHLDYFRLDNLPPGVKCGMFDIYYRKANLLAPDIVIEGALPE